VRPRGRDKHLPACVYRRHGAYWYVKRGRWTRLGDTLPSALSEYSRIIAPPSGACDELLDRTLAKCKETVAANTYLQYAIACKKLKPVLAEFSPELVESHHVAAILDHFRQTPNMANRMLTFLRLSFSNGLTWGLCRTNPCYGVKRHAEHRRDRNLTQAEYYAIWTAAPAQLRAIMDIAYLTGQRIGDVLAIRLADISEEGIAFQQQKTGKRLMVNAPALPEAIRRAKSLHSNVRGLTLFHGRGGKPLSYYGVRSAFQRACEAAKIEDTTLHDIRAKAAMDTKNQGRDPQALLGHTTAAQTVRYLRGREYELVNGPSIGQSLEYWTEDGKKSTA
jgi:integrase